MLVLKKTIKTEHRKCNTFVFTKWKTVKDLILRSLMITITTKFLLKDIFIWEHNVFIVKIHLVLRFVRFKLLGRRQMEL